MNITQGKSFVKNAVSPFFGSLHEGLGQIIVLHRILPESKRQRLRNTGIEITGEHLEEIILFFKRKKYDFISLDDLPDYLSGKRKNKFVIFTLDDGYIDNLTHAYPIFKKYDVPFTIYVTTNFPDKKAVLWWYLLEDLLLKENKISFDFQGEHISRKLQSYAEKEEAFNFLRHLIKGHQEKEQSNLMEILFTNHNMPLYDKVEEMALDWSQIKQLNADPLVTIAAHTVTHPSFKIIDDAQILDEVQQSVEILESKLQTPIEHFAYPYGSPVEVGKREIGLLAKTKIKSATTGRRGNIMTGHLDHMLALPRLYVGPLTTERYLNNFINGRIPFIEGAKQRVVTL